jgi:penicillin-binding protein 1B
MKRAILLPNYSDVRPFSPPSGVVQLAIDKVTNEVATPACPDDYYAAFIEGTQPTQTCEQPGPEQQRTLIQKIFGLDPKPETVAAVSNPSALPPRGESAPGAGTKEAQAKEDKSRKKGFFRRIFGTNDDRKDRIPDER